MRTRDLNEAVEAVTKVFCPHTVEVLGRTQRVDMRLKVKHPTVELSYDAKVKIQTGFSRNLVMHCRRGSAATNQEGRTAEWHRGHTMPFSAGLETQLWFDAQCLQETVPLDTEKLEEQCARLLGRPLDQPLRFALKPFSEDLEQAWQWSLAFLGSSAGNRLALSPAASAAFDEFLLTMLLHQHPHNFSEEMASTVSTPIPGLVRRAERFMADNAEMPITVSDVANHLGVSLRSLQSGFRSWRNSTPSDFLRRVRLQRVRDNLLCSDGQSDVTTVALRYGFAHLGRFSAHYRAMFGESPRVTLRQGRASKSRT